MKARLAAALAAWLAGALGGCGGTDEVENPAVTSLTATLQDAQGRPAAGRVALYARFQNPLTDSVALLAGPAGEQGAEFRAEDLLKAMDSASRAGLPWTNRDSVAFNLVGVRGTEEVFGGGYLLVKGASGAYAFRRPQPSEEGWDAVDGSLSTRLPLAPAVTGFAGNVGTRGLELGLTALFIPGSPYKARIRPDGSFELPRLAPGRYDVKAADADGKVYSPPDSLATDAAFAPADWSEADIIWVD